MRTVQTQLRKALPSDRLGVVPSSQGSGRVCCFGGPSLRTGEALYLVSRFRPGFGVFGSSVLARPGDREPDRSTGGPLAGPGVTLTPVPDPPRTGQPIYTYRCWSGNAFCVPICQRTLLLLL